VRVGNRHRTFEQPALLHPRRARHLAVAIQREPRGEDRIGVGFPTRVNDGHTRADRSLADHQLSTAGVQRGVADFDAGDVGDCIERTGGPADRQLEITFSRLLRVESCRQDEKEQQPGDECAHVQPRVGES
jgi:hypothetical protein